MNIIPAILEKDLYQIKSKLDFLRDIKSNTDLDFNIVQIDICDGIFTENITWSPETNEDTDLYDLFDDYKNHFSFEYHLMCKNPIHYFNLLKDLNSKNFVIHIDDLLIGDKNFEDYKNIFDIIKKENKEFIISANTLNIFKNKEKFIDFIEKIIDLYKDIKIQIMGIDKIGVQGQEFNLDSLNLLNILNDSLNNKISFQIDGGINNKTINLIKDTKINFAVVGSFLSNTNSKEDFINRYDILLS